MDGTPYRALRRGTRPAHAPRPAPVLAVLLALLAGCISETEPIAGSHPSVYSGESPAADFSRYRSYDYAQPLGTDHADGTRSVVSTYLIEAVDEQLQGRGFRRSADPDLLVNLHLLAEEQVAAGPSGPSRRYSGRFRQRRSPKPPIWSKGALALDLRDTRKDRVVWEALVQGPAHAAEPGDPTREDAHELVGRIFEPFTHSAGAAPEDGG